MELLFALAPITALVAGRIYFHIRAADWLATLPPELRGRAMRYSFD